jgi:transcription termination/antitermination protein NusG
MEEEKKHNAHEPIEQNIEEPTEQKDPGAASEPVQSEPPRESSGQAEVPSEEPKVEETPAPIEDLPAGQAGVKEEEVVEDKRWYVIQTLTGQEDKVKKAIDMTIEKQKMGKKFSQVLVPTEDTVEIKGGKRVEKVKKMFPGYVFLEMILDDESWFMIRNTPWVARFIGTKVRPTPVSDREMQRVLKQLGREEKLLEINFEQGEAVRVISGPFRGYTGTVDEVNADKGKLKVLINIFGRDTPVEVNCEHAQKMV